MKISEDDSFECKEESSVHYPNPVITQKVAICRLFCWVLYLFHILPISRIINTRLIFFTPGFKSLIDGSAMLVWFTPETNSTRPSVLSKASVCYSILVIYWHQGKLSNTNYKQTWRRPEPANAPKTTKIESWAKMVFFATNLVGFSGGQIKYCDKN